MRKKLWLDLETYSEINLKTAGSYRYFEDPFFEIMLFAYALDDGPVKVLDWTDGNEHWPDELLEAVEDKDRLIMAHNAMFDRVALKTYGYEFANTPDRWFCTMAAANLHQLPAGLDQLCMALKIPVEKSKMRRGQELVRTFCIPKPDNQHIHRHTKHTNPEAWQEFVEYAGQDIVAMRACWDKMPKWNVTQTEVDYWRIDQRMNDRGVYVDQELCRAAVREAKRAKDLLNDSIVDITDGDVMTAGQVDAMLEHVLFEFGVSLPDMRARTIEKRIEDEALPEPLRDLLRARLGGSKTTSSKFNKALTIVCDDGRARGMFAFAAAERTCRWAARLVQPQNLMRTPKYLHDQLPEAIYYIKEEMVADVYDDPMQVIGACARPMFTAAPGNRLIVSDLMNIEGRGMAWEAGEEWRLQAFREFDAGIGEDMYELGYSKSFHEPLDVVKKDTAEGGKMRLMGKVGELALQYQGAIGAYQSMGAVYGLTLPDDEALVVVKRWRKASPNIVSWWYELEKYARMCVKHPGKKYESRCVTLEKRGGWLRIRLPSGRYLCYPAIRINSDDGLDFMGRDRLTKRWTRVDLYGGKISQAITQAIARDVLAHNMPLLDDYRYDLVMTVHDENVTEVPEDSHHSVNELNQIMCNLPSWAKGLPLNASGYESQFYKKD